MTSQISFGKLLREDLRRRRWMIALSLLVEILGGPILLLFAFSVNRSYRFYDSSESIYSDPQIVRAQAVQSAIYEFFGEVYPVVLFSAAVVGALIVAVWGFGHLYSKRRTDLYHSAPISRGRQFLALYLNGLLVWAVPLAVGFLLTLLLAVARYPFGVPAAQVWSTFPAILHQAFLILREAVMLFLATYHLCLVAVMVSGTIFNSLVNIVIFGFGASLVYVTVYLMCEEGFTTFVRLAVSFESVCWLSPLLSPLYLIFSRSGYARGFFSRELIVCFFGTLALIAGNFVLALRLYQKRPSENAEGGVASRPLQALLRTGCAVLAGLLGGVLLYELTDTGQEGARLGWAIFGVVFCCVFAYGVFEIIHQRTFRAFFSHRLPMAAVTAVSVLLFAAFLRDWFGYDRYIPSRSNIDSADVWNLGGFTEGDYGNWPVFDEDGNVAGNQYMYDGEYARAQLADPEVIRALLASGASYTRDFRNGTERADASAELTNLTIEVTRRFGGSYVRTYLLETSCLDALRAVVENETYLRTNYPVATGVYPLPKAVDIEIGRYDTSIGEGMGQEAIRRLLEAYRADFREHATLEALSETMIAARLTLKYPQGDSGAGRQGYYRMVIRVPADYERTLALLREEGTQFPPDTKSPDLVTLLRFEDDYEFEYTPDFLYSYFGLPGYPDLGEWLAERYPNTWRYYSGTEHIMEVSAADRDRILAEGIAGGFLYESRGAHSLQPRYVFAGYVGRTGEMWSLYVPAGALPKELIDRITVRELDNMEYSAYEEELFGAGG